MAARPNDREVRTIKIFLSYNNLAEVIELPVNPEQFEIDVRSGHKSYRMPGVGEVVLTDLPEAASIVLNSFFPAAGTRFYAEGMAEFSPAECVDTIERWRDSLQPMRLTVSGGARDISLPCVVERFVFSERFAEEGDIYFRLELKEYKWYKTLRLGDGKSAGNYVQNAAVGAVSLGRSSEIAEKTSYVVRSGDTLWAICQKLLGDGSRYREVAVANGIKNPNLIYVGQVIRL